MAFFNKDKDSEPLTDPFDERLMISVGNQIMSLFMWKKEMREKIKEFFDIINEIKNNPLFKKVEEHLKENLAVTEKQKIAVLESQKRIENLTAQIFDFETKLTELSNKISLLSSELDKKTSSYLTEINSKVTLCLAEINKKTTEVQNISIKAVLDAVQKNLDDFKKNEAERYLKDLEETKKKIADFVNNNVNIAVEEIINRLYHTAKIKIKEATGNGGLQTDNKTQDNTIEDDEEFILPE